ncbi:hypothetical protein [Gordonia sp. NPDC003376]
MIIIRGGWLDDPVDRAFGGEVDGLHLCRRPGLPGDQDPVDARIRRPVGEARPTPWDPPAMTTQAPWSQFPHAAFLSNPAHAWPVSRTIQSHPLAHRFCNVF